MSAALAWLEDDLPTPCRARHLYLVAVDGCMVASDGNRRHAACMRTGTSALPANNNKKHSFRDVRELITSVVEENREFDKTGKPLASGKTPIATRYVYDPLKQITQVIDYKLNITKVEYDKLVSYPHRPQAVLPAPAPIFSVFFRVWH